MYIFFCKYIWLIEKMSVYFETYYQLSINIKYLNHGENNNI
jgi:hypothetical protein